MSLRPLQTSLQLIMTPLNPVLKKDVSVAYCIDGANAGGRTRMAVNRQILSLDKQLTEAHQSNQISNIECDAGGDDTPAEAGDRYKNRYNHEPDLRTILEIAKRSDAAGGAW